MAKVLQILFVCSIAALMMSNNCLVEAKPFFFKFFAPSTRASTSSSSSSVSTQLLVPDFFTQKLSILSGLLASGSNFGFGINKFGYASPTTTTTTEKPKETTELETVFVPESTEAIETSTTTTTTTEKPIEEGYDSNPGAVLRPTTKPNRGESIASESILNELLNTSIVEGNLSVQETNTGLELEAIKPAPAISETIFTEFSSGSITSSNLNVDGANGEFQVLTIKTTTTTTSQPEVTTIQPTTFKPSYVYTTPAAEATTFEYTESTGGYVYQTPSQEENEISTELRISKTFLPPVRVEDLRFGK